MHGLDHGPIELQERLAPGEDHKAPQRGARPSLSNCLRKLRGTLKTAASRPVGTDKIGIAELADRRAAILLAAGPQISAGETAEHGRTPRRGALDLQRLEDFFDGISHAPCSAGIICVSCPQGTRGWAAGLPDAGPNWPAGRPRNAFRF